MIEAKASNHAGEPPRSMRAVLDMSRGSSWDVLVWPAWRRRGIGLGRYTGSLSGRVRLA